MKGGGASAGRSAQDVGQTGGPPGALTHNFLGKETHVSTDRVLAAGCL